MSTPPLVGPTFTKGNPLMKSAPRLPHNTSGSKNLFSNSTERPGSGSTAKIPPIPRLYMVNEDGVALDGIGGSFHNNKSPADPHTPTSVAGVPIANVVLDPLLQSHKKAQFDNEFPPHNIYPYVSPYESQLDAAVRILNSCRRSLVGKSTLSLKPTHLTGPELRMLQHWDGVTNDVINALATVEGMLKKLKPSAIAGPNKLDQITVNQETNVFVKSPQMDQQIVVNNILNRVFGRHGGVHVTNLKDSWKCTFAQVNSAMEFCRDVTLLLMRHPWSSKCEDSDPVMDKDTNTLIFSGPKVEIVVYPASSLTAQKGKLGVINVEKTLQRRIFPALARNFIWDWERGECVPKFVSARMFDKVGWVAPSDEALTKLREVPGFYHRCDRFLDYTKLTLTEEIHWAKSFCAFENGRHTVFPSPVGTAIIVVVIIDNLDALWKACGSNCVQVSVEMVRDVVLQQGNMYGGYDAEMVGDCCLLAFTDRTNAMTFCLEIQKCLLEVGWPHIVTANPLWGPIENDEGKMLFNGLRTRCAMIFGPVVTTKKGIRTLYSGTTVEATKRLAWMADGGELLCISNEFEDDKELRSWVQRNADVSSLGMHSLCHFDLVEIMRVLPKELKDRRKKFTKKIVRGAVVPDRVPFLTTANHFLTVLQGQLDRANSMCSLLQRRNLGPFPTGSVAFLICNFPSGTGWSTHPDDMLDDMLNINSTVAKAVIQHMGVEIESRGDSLIAVFDEIERAGDCVVELLKLRYNLRLGIHYGTPAIENGRYSGPVLNKAVRIGAHARKNEVLMEHSTRRILEHFRNRFGEVSFSRVGVRHLHGTKDPTDLHTMLLSSAPPAANNVLQKQENLVEYIDPLSLSMATEDLVGSDNEQDDESKENLSPRGTVKERNEDYLRAVDELWRFHRVCRDYFSFLKKHKSGAMEAREVRDRVVARMYEVLLSASETAIVRGVPQKDFPNEVLRELVDELDLEDSLRGFSEWKSVSNSLTAWMLNYVLSL